MEWLNILIGALGGIVGAIGSAIGMFIYFPQTKKQKEIENDKSINQQWVDLYREMEKKNEDNATLIQELNNEKLELMQKLNNKEIELANKEVELILSKVKECKVRGCRDREPDTGY